MPRTTSLSNYKLLPKYFQKMIKQFLFHNCQSLMRMRMNNRKKKKKKKKKKKNKKKKTTEEMYLDLQIMMMN